MGAAEMDDIPGLAPAPSPPEVLLATCCKDKPGVHALVGGQWYILWKSMKGKDILLHRQKTMLCVNCGRRLDSVATEPYRYGGDAAMDGLFTELGTT
jgi:hypothetical protein